MKGIFERVQFLERRLDRLEVILLEQDRIIRAQAKVLGMGAQKPRLEPGTKSMVKIASEVAHDNGLTLAELKGADRQFAVARPRQYAFVLMSDAGFSASAIARFFGLDHTTVLYGIKAAKRRMSVSCQLTDKNHAAADFPSV